MKRFLRELRIIAFLAAVIPAAMMFVTVGLWWTADSRAVIAVYLLAVLILFVVGILASLRDEMGNGEADGYGRR